MTNYRFDPILDLTYPEVMRERMIAAQTARAGGFFWLPCPLCGMEFGGHETQQGSADQPSSVHMPGDPPNISQCICPPCTWAGRGKTDMTKE